MKTMANKLDNLETYNDPRQIQHDFTHKNFYNLLQFIINYNILQYSNDYF